jgi:hypothetical protein
LCEVGPGARLAESLVGGEGETVSKTKAVAKRTPLKCLDCGCKFQGRAVYKEHYVERGTVLAKTVFDRALENCPVCRSHRVDERR